MIHMLAQAATAAESTEGYLLWGFILLGAALGLLVLELFVPSGGLIGVLCGIAAIGSIVSFMMHDAVWGLGALAFYVVLGPMIVVFALKVWVRSPFAKQLILGAEQMNLDQSSEEAYEESERSRRMRMGELQALIGSEGVTVTPLRPVGFVRLQGHRIDAQAESGVIESNTPVIVVDVYDNQIKVRPK